MAYDVRFTPTFEKQLKKMKQKDNVLFERVGKKIKEIRKNPYHYKPLKNVLKGTRRAHLDPFIIIFSIEGKTISLHYEKHHDDAY